jgi:hypothetical protein
MVAGQFHVGTFFLGIATILLLLVSVSAPIWHKLAFLKVTIGGSHGTSTLSFGNWGYCLLQTGGDVCSGRSIGYDMARIVSSMDGTTFSSATETSVHNISRALILHPIAAALSFLAFFTAVMSHRIGFLFASFLAALATFITLIALILDFVNFDIIHHHVNSGDGPGSGAHWSWAIWLVVAAFVSLVIGSLTACCGCFTDRRKRGRTGAY